MQYLVKTKWDDIKDNYDFIVAWGTGSLFNMNHRTMGLPIDMLVDGTKKQIGKRLGDFTVCEPNEIIKKMNGKVLIIIYTIYEPEILIQIEKLGIIANTIIYNLLEINNVNRTKFPRWNGKHADDIVLLELIQRLGLTEIEYLDIGVCHPVMRNNTYSLYDLGWKGVLVEPNPIFHSLISQYRERDHLLACGAGTVSGELDYYAFPDRLGYGTFDEKLGKARIECGLRCTIKKIPIIGINEIIEENFKGHPTIIDVDIEGMDFELLNHLDTDKYPVEIIMCETLSDEEKYRIMMNKKGYSKYACIGENTIFFRTDLNISGLYKNLIEQ